MCGQLVIDYVLQMCYVIPCEHTEISINYFERLALIGMT